jgi:chromosome segregation ATPase
MSQSFWETEAVEEPQAEMEHEQTPTEAMTEAEPQVDAGALALSVDDFTALEERIHRAVNLVKRERQARVEAEERAVHAEAQLREQTPHIELLEKEISTLRAERDHVRVRVERLLAQLDTLEI